jgi:hypothetical protein
MEDFEKIKEISSEEAKKILPENIAYMTMDNGEIIIVNGLDHNKYDQREKEYESFVEEQSKFKSGTKNLESDLQKIQEDTEENERNSNQLNPLNYLNNYNKIKMDLNQKYYQEVSDNFNKMEISPFPNQMDINNPNNFNQFPIIDNDKSNNINNINNMEIYSFPEQMENNSYNNINNQINFKQSPYIQNNNYPYSNNLNQVQYLNRFPPQRLMIQTNSNIFPMPLNQNQYYYREGLRDYDKYIRYNNHNFVEIKQIKSNKNQ